MIRHFLSASSFILLSVLTLSAHAADIEIDGTVTTTQNLGVGDALIVTEDGHLLVTGYAVSIDNGDIPASITNHGIIEGTQEAIHLQDNTGLSGGIVNYGLITSGGHGIHANHSNSTLTNGIINYGTIHGDISGIAEGSSGFGDIMNMAGGVISGGTGAGYTSYYGSWATRIINSGLITGHRGIETSGVPWSGLYLGMINEAGGIIEGTSGTAILIHDADPAAPAPITLNGGRVIGDIIDMGPYRGRTPVTIGGDFTTEGNFNVSSLTVNSASRFTIAPTNAITLYDMPASTGAWIFSVDDSSTFGTLTVTNGDVDFRGASVAVNMGLGSLTAGERLLIASGNGTVNGGAGQATQLVSDNSLLWNFLMEDGSYSGNSDNDLYLLVARANTAAAAAGTSNNRAVAPRLESLDAASDQAVNQVLTNLNTAATEEEVDNVLEATLPVLNNSALQSSMSAVNVVFDITGNRLQALRTGVEQGDGATGTGLRLWGQVFGEHGRQTASGGFAGYQAHSHGMAMGADTDALYDRLTAGVALSYARSDIDGGGVNKPAMDIDSYQLTLYGDYDLTAQAFLNMMGAYAFGRNDTMRRDIGAVAGLNAFGGFDSHTYSLRAETGYDIRQAALTVTPSVLALYTHYDADSYDEAGAGGVSLSDIDSEAVNRLDIGAAARASWDIAMADDTMLRPAVHAGYRYDVIGDDTITRARFAGGDAAFTAQGATQARGMVNTGLSLEYRRPDGWEFSGGYEFRAGRDYTAHAGTAKASFKF